MTNLHDPNKPSTPEDPPKLLPTVDPTSPMGRALQDAVARLRFADVPPEVKEMAQRMLEGRATARDLVAMPEFQPALIQGQARLREEVDAMTPEEREEFLRPGGAAGAGAGSRG